METFKKLMENKMFKIFTIAIVGIILLIIIISVLSGGGSANVSEKSLTNAATKYINENSSARPLSDYDTRLITVSTLVSNGYLSASATGSSCASYVLVTRLDNEFYYTPYIKCNGDKDSLLLKNKLLKDVVETGTGLYYEDGGYSYKGESPNNYVKINGLKWRVMGIDDKGNIKLIYGDSSYEYVVWDDRYNSETDKQSGINDYSLSRLKEYLDKFLNIMIDKETEMFPNSVKVRLAKFTQCVGKIDIENQSINACSDTLEDQWVGMVTAEDYVNTSLDESCDFTNIKNCQNYNFLNKSSWTISAYSGDSEKVYYIDKYKGLNLGEAYVSRAIYPIITLRSDVIYLSGTGTESDPYLVK